MDALTFLAQKKRDTSHSVYVVVGEEAFLRRQVLERLTRDLVTESELEFALAPLTGDQLTLSELRNEWDTLPFLCSKRLLVVDAADGFISKNRSALEQLVVEKRNNRLILVVKTFPKSTRLATMIPASAQIACKEPALHHLPGWLCKWTKEKYQKTLGSEEAQRLVELVGSQMGLLDQAVQKLALASDKENSISASTIMTHIGHSAEANVFQILDYLGEKKIAEAFMILHRLKQQKTEPMAILAPMAYQIRRIASVRRALDEGLALGPAMDAAQVPQWPKARQSLQKQLQNLGTKARQLSAWLLAVDAGLKGGNLLDPYLQLEKFLWQLATD